MAFLVSLAARHPAHLYESDRRRLGTMVLATSTTERARLLADAARRILEQASAGE